MNMNLSFSVFTANIVSLLLIGTLYMSNVQRIGNDRDMRIVRRMMAITAVSNEADVLRKSFSEYGVVTRCAGDEFVVMLNTTDEQFVSDLIRRSKKFFEEENETNNKPYKLSAAMGFAVSDLRVETIGDFMNRIDRQMYLDKKQQARAVCLKNRKSRVKRT